MLDLGSKFSKSWGKGELIFQNYPLILTNPTLPLANLGGLPKVRGNEALETL
jgi:hypothetical protein